MKRTLYIIVIVIGLGGALVMGYLAMTSGDSPGSDSIIEAGANPQVYNILPKGKSLDFGTLENFNKDNRLYPYPQVNTTEVGKNLGNLID